jgi:hypothetical protein
MCNIVSFVYPGMNMTQKNHSVEVLTEQNTVLKRKIEMLEIHSARLEININSALLFLNNAAKYSKNDESLEQIEIAQIHLRATELHQVIRSKNT